MRKELERATKDNKPAFVMCHQAFAFTHGLPEVWKTGDMGEQSDEVRAVMEQFKNVFFINGHLHGGVFEKTFEILNEENVSPQHRFTHKESSAKKKNESFSQREKILIITVHKFPTS